MASHLFLLVLVQASLLLHGSVLCDPDKELLQGLNSYRTASNLSILTKNKKATCVAELIAEKIKDKECVPTSNCTAVSDSGVGSQFGKYDELLKKCYINRNTTREGIILPVCVPKFVRTLVFTNYTLTAYVKYVNDSTFSGAGIGTQKDWIVVILTTNSSTGNFTSGVDGRDVNWLLGLSSIVYFVLFN